MFVSWAVENIAVEIKLIRYGNKLWCYRRYVDSLVIYFGA